MGTPDLNLETTILGIGPNAESTIADNFKKIDTVIAEMGGAESPNGLTVLVGTIPEDQTGPIIAEDSVTVALAKLQGRIDALETPG